MKKEQSLKKMLLLLFIFTSSLATTAQKVEGDWYGMLEDEQEPRRINLHVSKQSDTYHATLDSPDRFLFDLKVDTIIVKFPRIFFKTAYSTYNGIINEKDNTIVGNFFQGDRNMKLDLQRKKIEAPDNSIAKLFDSYTKKEVYINMRDGKKLFTSIYSPKDKTKKYPILMNRTPYNAEPDEKSFNRGLAYYARLLKEGYIFVVQDVRGRFQSEGKFQDVRPYNPDKKSNKDIDESSDTFDSMDWLIKNVPNNNGKIGIFGISYPGFYSTLALMESHPALKAVSPQAPVSDWFIGDDFHHNGAFFLLDAFSFYSSVGRPRPKPTRQWPSSFNWKISDNYEFFLRIGPIKNVEKRYFGDTIQFWDKLMGHPDYDDFWKATVPLPHLKNVKPAVLTVGGWFDAEDLYGPLNTYSSIEKQNPPSISNRLVMGPWSHGQWAASSAKNMGNVHWGMNTNEYYQKLETKFFNYYLKEQGDMDIAEATIFITGSNQWKEFETWPPKNLIEKQMYFHPSGKIGFSPPTGSNSFDEYIVDPWKPVPYTEDAHLYRTREYMTDDQRFAARRPDVMVYKSDILTEDITLAGPIDVSLFVSTTGTDADYVVKIIDVFPDEISNYPDNDKNVPMAGYQMLVRGDVFRGKYRNSYEKPEPFVPGEITKVRINLPDVAHTFKKGHRIMVQVQNSWFPLVDINPQKFVNIYKCDEIDFQKATHRIYHDSKYPSHIKVKVLQLK